MLPFSKRSPPNVEALLSNPNPLPHKNTFSPSGRIKVCQREFTGDNTHTRTHTHTYTINYATISTTSTQSNTDLDPLCDNYVPLKKKEISCKSSYDAHTLDEEMVIDFHCA